ncbi:hypothetical protein [Croceicoccus mobilis]|uniref:Uncharacterized protein n=1 Tax=Croceicoccus mobilis TaxID=1703339 RepID=A0A916YVH8_9SPHN|nr:hypothetical protein [Croceicoccus mobilis]GGD62814.1 hypothetical protein GCM10010990_10330 [Croceicoccus mobilis]
MADILKSYMLDGLRYYRSEAEHMLAMAHDIGDVTDAKRLERQIDRIDNRIRACEGELAH